MAEASNQGPKRLGRIGLLVWLIVPLLIVLGLWLMIDRTQGRPDPSLMRHPPGEAPTGGAAPSGAAPAAGAPAAR